jgi:hypothetical protein
MSSAPIGVHPRPPTWRSAARRLRSQRWLFVELKRRGSMGPGLALVSHTLRRGARQDRRRSRRLLLEETCRAETPPDDWVRRW